MPHHFFHRKGEHLLAARKTRTQRGSDDSPSVDLARIPARTPGWPHSRVSGCWLPCLLRKLVRRPHALTAALHSGRRIAYGGDGLVCCADAAATQSANQGKSRGSAVEGVERLEWYSPMGVWCGYLCWRTKAGQKSRTAVDIAQRPTVHCLHRLQVDDTEAAASQLCS